jgi:predicted enzyme related to lactoylglutathione lyase
MALMTKPVTATLPVHTVLPASDIDRAERFYHDVLGMEIERQDTGAGRAFIAHAGDATTVFVYETNAAPGAATNAMYLVDDLDAAMADLRERGVVFEDYSFPEWHTVNGVAEMAGNRAAWFKDSEGNIFNLATM